MIKKLKTHKNFIVYGFGQIINLIVPIIIAPIIIKVCGLENFGKVGVATSIFLIISLFIDFGSLLIGVKEISINKENKSYIKNYLSVVYTLKIIVFTIILILILVTLSIFNFTEDFYLYLFSIPLLIAQVFNPLWIYQGKEDFKTSNQIVFFSKSLYLILVFLFVNNKEDYILIIPFLGIANTVTYLFFFNRIYNNYNLKLFKVDYKLIKEEISTTFPILLSNIFISVYTNAPIIIVKNILGDYAAGIYRIGDMILMIFRNYLSVFFNVSFPKFCSLYSKSKSQGNTYLKKINLYNIILLTIATLSIFTACIIFVSISDIENSSKEAISFCSKFLFIPLVIAINIPFYQTLIFKNEQKSISKIIFISTCSMLLMCYLFTLHNNISGTLISIYLSEVLTTSLIIIIYFRKKLLKKV